MLQIEIECLLLNFDSMIAFATLFN